MNDLLRPIPLKEGDIIVYTYRGEYGFVIRNAKPLPFQPCKGALGFFRPKL